MIQQAGTKKVYTKDLERLFEMYQKDLKLPFFLDIAGPLKGLSEREFLEECRDDAEVRICEIDGKEVGFMHLFDIEKSIGVANFHVYFWDSCYPSDDALATRYRTEIDTFCKRHKVSRIQTLLFSSEVLKERFIERMGFVREGTLRQQFFWKGTSEDLDVFGLSWR